MPARTLGLILLLLATVGCTRGLREGEEALRSPSTSSVTPSASSGPVSSPTPQEGPGGRPIVLDLPQPDSEIMSPVLVRGTAVTGSGRVGIRVLDAHGMELAAIVVDVSCGADCRGTFRAQLAFYVPSAQAGTIEVAEDASSESDTGDVRSRPVEVSVSLIPGV